MAITAGGNVPTKGLEVWGVLWLDAHFNANEFERHEVTHRPVNYVTVGIMVKDDETGITLSTDICESNSFRGLNFIPRQLVIAAWKIGPVRKLIRIKHVPVDENPPMSS